MKRLLAATFVACVSIPTVAFGEDAAVADQRAAVQKLIADGKYAEAETAARTLLARVEATDGTDSLAAANVLDALVDALLGTGKAADPETRLLADRSLAIKEKALGPEHVNVAVSLNNLALLLNALGDRAGARPVHERALAIREKALGPEHTDVAWSLNNLGSVLRDMGDHAAARPLLERSLTSFERALGPEHPDVAVSLHNLALILQATGDHAGARPLHERCLAINEKALGPEHPDVAWSLNNLGSLLQAMGNHAEARPLYERSLTIFERALGPQHRDVAVSLSSLASLLQDMGDHAGARPLHERSLAISEKTLGPEHPDVAVSLSNLALLLQAMGDHASARPLYERSLAIGEKALGPDHLDVALSLDNLGSLLQDMADHAAARPLHERALAIREKALGPEHPHVAVSLNNVGSLLQAMGDHAGARPLYERSLTILERTLGSEHPHVAVSLNNLGRLLQAMGDHAGARPLHERSLAIGEKALGPEHPRVATSLSTLASLLQAMGDHAGARPLYERALAIREKALGPEHPNVAGSLNNLASLLQDMGDHAGAQPLHERALAIREKALGPEHPDVAVSLSTLASLLQDMGDHAGARPLHERALAIREKALGPEHSDVAVSLNNLGALLQVMGGHAEARPLYERALAIREKALGPQHQHVAASLNNLGSLLQVTGDHAGARPLYERSLTIFERALSPEHPDVARPLHNLALLHCTTGDTALALEAALRSESIGRDHARLTFRALSERQALRLASVRPRGVDAMLSLASVSLPVADRARAWDAVVRSRALVLDEIGARHRSASGSFGAAPAAQALASASQRLANLTVRGPRSDTPERYRKLIDDAAQEKERAERALAEQSASFSEEQVRSRLGLAEVMDALSRGDALVAYSRHARHPIGPGVAQPGTARAAEPKPVPSYMAFVLRGGEKEPAAVALGAAEEIDTLVKLWHDEVSRPDGGREAGEALRARAWDPIAASLGDATRVFVVPDGALNLVSFAALAVGAQQYLAETGPTLHYLSAERDLVPAALPAQRGEGLLALGGPAFDETALFARLAPAAGAGPRLVATTAALAPGSFRGEHSACGGFAGLRFAPLSGAAREASEVASLWRARDVATDGAAVLHLSGEAASEAAFKTGASGKRVLHVATHGFFLGGECKSALDATRGVEMQAQEAPPLVTGENPLLLSGLALAGANHRDAATTDEEDGILTAEEIASLDLSGVEWAVLSACDTGLGDVQAGEGVFGLRRAFQVAGAGTVIMSLWSVDDEATRQWMRELYRARLERRLDTAECVREASLSVLRSRREKGESTSPFYWAGFVAAGDWR